MKRSLAINAVLAVALTAVFCGLFFAPKNRLFRLQVSLATSTDAYVQLFYDVGRGISEEDSIRRHIKAGAPATLQFDLPAGDYRHLRFDPLDRPGRATISELSLIAPSGATQRRFRLGEFRPSNEIAVSPRPDGMTEVAVSNHDPILDLAFAVPLALRAGWRDYFAVNASRFGLFFFATFLLLVGAHALARRWTQILPRLSAWRDKNPRAALASVALLAALLACHPLIFAGNSLVSPNFHIALLYPDAPAVPGVTEHRREDVQGADIGAMMWAHLPYTAMQREAFRAGELPLWNRYGSAGVPLLGQGQSMVGDPLHLPVVLANGASWAVDLKFFLLRALFACGLGWTVLALRRDWIAAALVAFAAPFIGFFIVRVNHPAIFSVCYSPWLLWAWVRIVQAPTLRATGVAAGFWFVANWCLLTSGTVKEATMLIASINAVGLAALIFARDAVGLKLRKAALLAITGVALVLASMPHWLTFADTLVRARTFSDQLHAARIPRGLLIGFFDDLFYREIDGARRIFCPSMNLFLFAGVLWSLVRLLQQLADPIGRWILAGAFVALGIAVDWIPSEWLMLIPGLRNVGHLHNTFSCVALVLFSVVAGFGFASARETLLLPWRQWLGPIAMFVAVPAWLLWQYYLDRPEWWRGSKASWSGWWDKVPEHGYFYAALFSMIAGIVLLHIVARRAWRTRSVSWAAGVWVAISLLVLLAPHGLQLPLDFRAEFFLTPPTRADLHVTSPTIDRLRAEIAREPFRIAGTGATLMPNFGAFHGLESFYGPDALFSRHYHELMIASALGRTDDWMWGPSPEMLAVQRPLFDLINVKYIVSPTTELPGSGYERVATLDLSIHASPTAWPRAFFADRVLPYHGAHQIVAIARAHPGRPFAAVLESDLAAVSAQAARHIDATPGSFDRATEYRITPNSTSFTVHAPGPGVIALHEAWFKEDFRVTVNGSAVPYFRVNHAFKGISVERAGEYRVTFRYWPRHLTLSLLCSAAGFALLAAGGCWVWKRAAPSPPPTPPPSIR
jgi:hypothetical protein